MTFDDDASTENESGYCRLSTRKHPYCNLGTTVCLENITTLLQDVQVACDSQKFIWIKKTGNNRSCRGHIDCSHCSLRSAHHHARDSRHYDQLWWVQKMYSNCQEGPLRGRPTCQKTIGQTAYFSGEEKIQTVIRQRARTEFTLCGNIGRLFVPRSLSSLAMIVDRGDKNFTRTIFFYMWNIDVVTWSFSKFGMDPSVHVLDNIVSKDYIAQVSGQKWGRRQIKE